VEDGDAKVLLGDFQLFGDELPRERDSVALEVIAEREVPEHFEEGVMARGVADLFEVVVFAAGADALLARGGATIAVGRLFHAEEDFLELDHAGVGEEQRRVIARDEGAGLANRVLLFREVGEEFCADFGGKHSSRNLIVAWSSWE
jgi:hypothetical protein